MFDAASEARHTYAHADGTNMGIGIHRVHAALDRQHLLLHALNKHVVSYGISKQGGYVLE